jgi:hypothetical protein
MLAPFLFQHKADSVFLYSLSAIPISSIFQFMPIGIATTVISSPQTPIADVISKHFYITDDYVLSCRGHRIMNHRRPVQIVFPGNPIDVITSGKVHQRLSFVLNDKSFYLWFPMTATVLDLIRELHRECGDGKFKFTVNRKQIFVRSHNSLLDWAREDTKILVECSRSVSFCIYTGLNNLSVEVPVDLSLEALLLLGREKHRLDHKKLFKFAELSVADLSLRCCDVAEEVFTIVEFLELELNDAEPFSLEVSAVATVREVNCTIAARRAGRCLGLRDGRVPRADEHIASIVRDHGNVCELVDTATIITIGVRWLTGETCRYNLDGSIAVSRLKELVALEAKHSPSEIDLSDDSEVLSDSKLVKDCIGTINAAPRRVVPPRPPRPVVSAVVPQPPVPAAAPPLSPSDPAPAPPVSVVVLQPAAPVASPVIEKPAEYDRMLDSLVRQTGMDKRTVSRCFNFHDYDYQATLRDLLPG